MQERTTPGASRRAFTLGALGLGFAATSTALGGCIRLEEGAPNVPLIPTRTPLPAEDALIQLLHVLSPPGSDPTSTPTPSATPSASGSGANPAPAITAPRTALARLTAALPTLHAQQARVLHDALRQRGVPADKVSAAPSPTPGTSGAIGTTGPTGMTGATGTTGPTSAPSSAPPRTSTPEAAARIVGFATECSPAPAELRPMLISLIAQSEAVYAARALAGTTPLRPGATAPPAKALTSGTSLVAALVTARRSRYNVEVAGARLPEAARPQAVTTSRALTRVINDLTLAAGSSAPPPEFGHALPFAVTTPTAAVRLIRQSVDEVLRDLGATLPLIDDADAGAMFDLMPRMIGAVAAQSCLYAAPPTPFPGLR